ncbi:hypothetical protein RZN22_17815 [Bacillaceae bacterium S4-13-58]
MNKNNLLKFLYNLNVAKAITIVSVLTIPILIFYLDFQVSYPMGKQWGQLAFIYYSLAIVLYAFLFSISHMKRSLFRKKLVTFTRIFIRFHVAIAIIGTLFVLFHASTMLYLLNSMNVTTTTGILTLLSLCGVLFTGYLRKLTSSGKRRRYHRYFAFLFFFFLIIHLFA